MGSALFLSSVSGQGDTLSQRLDNLVWKKAAAQLVSSWNLEA